MKKERVIYLDYLRVFAIFAVITLHVAAKHWDAVDVNGFDWQVFNCYDSIVRWGVSVFVMISGALFLNRDIPIKKLYSKYILRIVVAYIVWSAFYASLSSKCTSAVAFIKLLIGGHYHMWFLPMIVGLYMLQPLLKRITDDAVTAKYFAVLATVFAVIIPTIVAVVNDFAPRLLVTGVNLINGSLVGGLSLSMVMGFPLYFLMGHQINQYDLSIKQRRIIYVMGIIGLASTVWFSRLVSVKNQVAYETYYGNLTIGVFLTSIAVFTFVKYHYPDQEGINEVFKKLSKYSFGAFLVHPEVLTILNNFGLDSMAFNPIIAIPVTAIIAFIISIGISTVLNMIPILNKYLV